MATIEVEKGTEWHVRRQLSDTLTDHDDRIAALEAGGGGGGQAAIEFADDGLALGTAGTVTELDFTGAGVTASRALNKVTVNIPGGGSSGASGLTTVEFGAFPGSLHAVTAVADTGVAVTSSIQVRLQPFASADHSADEHIMAASMMDLIAGDIVAGVGFNIHAIARELGTEPLEQVRRDRQAANATVLLNQSSSGGAFGSVGGKSLSLLWGQFLVVWERT